MSDYIAWYVVELRSRLAPHLSRARVETIAKETRSHLVEATERLAAELQISEDAAQLAAIDAFGDLDRIVLGYLRAQDPRILGLRPVWFVVAFGALAVLCWDYTWLSFHGPFDNYGASWLTGLVGFIGFVALIGCFFACRVGRQAYGWRLAATHGAMLVILPLVASYLALTPDNSFGSVLRPKISSVKQTIPQALARLDRLETFFEVGGNRFAAAKSAADLPPEYRDIQVAEDQFDIPRGSSYTEVAGGGEERFHAFVTPSGSVWASQDGRLMAFQGETTFKEAKASWPERMPQTRASMERARQNLTSILASIHEAESGRWFFWNGPLIAEVMTVTVLLLPVTLFVPWLAFATVRRKRAWPAASLA